MLLGITGIWSTGLVMAQEPVFRTGATSVQVPVTVTDNKGRSILNLLPRDFQLLDDGVPREITGEIGAYPVSLVVAIQANLASEEALSAIRKASSLFEPLVMGATGEMAVLAFDHRVQTLTPFTGDAAAIKAAFGKLKAGSGQSHLNDAAMQAVNMLHTRSADRKKVLILLSETHDIGSSLTASEVLARAEFADIVVYAVALNRFLDKVAPKPATPGAPLPVGAGPPLPMGVISTGTTNVQMGRTAPIFEKEVFTAGKEVVIPNPVEFFTEFTGGREHTFVDQRDLEEALEKIGEEIHSQYVLAFSPGEGAESGYHPLVVKVLRPDVRVRARKGYWVGPR